MARHRSGISRSRVSERAPIPGVSISNDSKATHNLTFEGPKGHELTRIRQRPRLSDNLKFGDHLLSLVLLTSRGGAKLSIFDNLLHRYFLFLEIAGCRKSLGRVLETLILDLLCKGMDWPRQCVFLVV